MRRALACCALLALAAKALADDRLWIVTGEAARSDYYFSLGTIIPLPGSTLGNGWMQRYWADTFTYSYLSGPQEIRADVWGAEAMLGYAASRPGLSGALYLGGRYSNAHLSPDDPSSELNGNQLFGKAQAEGNVSFTQRLRGEGIVSYLFDLDGYWTRARLLYTLDKSMFVGPELIFQGDPNYTARKLGVALGGIQVLPKTWITFKAGYRWQSGQNAVYGGVELVGEY